jgi:hypothetical protein
MEAFRPGGFVVAPAPADSLSFAALIALSEAEALLVVKPCDALKLRRSVLALVG